MQVQGHTAVAPTAGARGVSDVNRNVGRFEVRYLDREDGVPFTLHQQFVTGGVVGARDGYDTLRVALAELRSLTERDVPAAVVIEREGRFYGRALKVRDLERGIASPLEALHLEADERVLVRSLRVEGQLHERVRALVDGAWTRRFRT